MLFLVEYDRAQGEIASLRVFDDAARRLAEESRLQLEIDLGHRRIEHEVVLLQAASEAAVRQTHRRYFATLEELRKPQQG